jgi:hypothetical protein
MPDTPVSSSTRAEGEEEQAVTEDLNPEIGLLGALAIGVGTMGIY